MSAILIWTTAIHMHCVLTLMLVSTVHASVGTVGMDHTVKVSGLVCFPFYFYCSAMVDIDECMLGIDTCDKEHAECIDTEGGYSCVCHIGYSGNGELCCMSLYDLCNCDKCCVYEQRV